jgi:hypothetical protein
MYVQITALTRLAPNKKGSECMGRQSAKRGRTSVAPPPTFLPESTYRRGRKKQGQQKCSFWYTWKTAIHSVTLEVWRAQSKKRLRQWMMEKERQAERQRKIWEALTQETDLEKGNYGRRLSTASKNQEDAELDQQNPPAIKPTPQKVRQICTTERLKIINDKQTIQSPFSINRGSWKPAGRMNCLFA